MYMGFKNIFKIFKTDKRIKIAKQFVNKKKYILEIGVHEGKFSELLLSKFHPKKMYLVDPWKYEVDFLYGDPGGNRTCNCSLGGSRYVHLTTGPTYIK